MEPYPITLVPTIVNPLLVLPTPVEMAARDPETLGDDETFNIFQQMVADAQVRTEKLYCLTVLASLQALLNHNQTLQKNNPERYTAYQLMEVLLQAHTLEWQSESVQQELFRKHVLFLLAQEVNLLEQVKRALTGYNFEEGGIERLVKALQYALANNEETIGTGMIDVDGTSTIPTLRTWLLDYVQSIPVDRPRTNLDQVRYLNTSKNAPVLTAEDRTMLLEVIKVYDFLRRPIGGDSLPIIEPTELPQRQIVLPKPARTFKPLPRPSLSVQPASMKPPQFPTVPSAPAEKTIPPTIDETITQAENMLLTETEGDAAKLQAALFVAVKTNKRDRIIAGLLILARLGELRTMLMSNKDLATVYEKNVVPALTKQLSIDATKVTSTYTPAHLREFLKYILTQAVGTETEAARYGAQIEAVMKSTGDTDYANMTYFESREGTYRWAQAQADEQGNLQ